MNVLKKNDSKLNLFKVITSTDEVGKMQENRSRASSSGKVSVCNFRTISDRNLLLNCNSNQIKPFFVEFQDCL